MIWLIGTALAWDSVCKDQAGDVCDYGLEPARERWNHPQESEHYDLMLFAMSLSGVPMELNDPITFKTWTDGLPVDTVLNADVESVSPVQLGAAGFASREMEPAEFAQLPDYSYGLYDWVAGNEMCLAFDGTDATTDADTCHNFTTHTGALNSSHFLPQARGFWGHYHQLALNRAAECAAMWPHLSGTPFEDNALACEKEAMAFEAVAQHYLQDAWSSGHMWERWGAPEYEPAKFPNGLNSAQVIAMFSGIVHGAKTILEDKLPGTYDDPLCGPHKTSVYIDPADSEKREGAGDLFLGSHLLTSDFDHQRQPFMGCSVESILEVYNATGQAHGEVGVASSSGFSSRDPWSDDCWNQRATNKAIANAWGVHVGATPHQVAIFSAKPPLLPRPTGGTLYRLLVAQFMGPMLDLLNFYGNGGEALNYAQWEQFRGEIAANTLKVMMEARLRPNKTNVAEGDVFSLLDVQPNGTWAIGGTGDVGVLPADYVDIGTWTLFDDDFRATAINLGFLDSHAPDRCAELGEDDLQEYIAAVQNAAPDDQGFACSQCATMIAPHVRIGTDELNYLETKKPLCQYVPDSGTPYLYTGDFAAGPTKTAAARICGCAEGMGIITRDTGDDDISFANRIGSDLELRGDYFPTGESPRDAVMGGTGNQLFVAAGEHVGIYVVTAGDEHEVDIDDDLDTMTDGAPVGVSRIDVGGPPRGIALQNTGRYGLVATKDEIVVFDQLDFEVKASYAKSFLGFTSSEKPYDIAISHDDTKAFVTAYGTYPHLANEVMVLDLSDMPHNLQLETTFHTGGDTQNQFLEISPDGTMVAVTCPEIDSVKVFSTTAPYDKIGNYTEEYNEQGHYPIAVDWSLESDAIYVGYLSGPYSSSLSGNGVVRKCYIDEPENCEHAVGVQNSVRDLLVTAEGIVWVGDDGGNMTPLSPELFDPGETTSGHDQQTGLLDGTGGCLDADQRAEPCPPAANAGRAISVLVDF
jgi:hypothetical protein